jgi:hypothetical protein
VYGRGRVKKGADGGDGEKNDVKGMSFECMNTITKMVSLDTEIKVSKKEANLSKIISDHGGSVKIDLSRP